MATPPPPASDGGSDASGNGEEETGATREQHASDGGSDASGNGEEETGATKEQHAAIEALYSSAEDVDDDGAVGRGELLRLLVDQPRVEWQAFAARWGARVRDEVMEEDKLNQDDFTEFAADAGGHPGGSGESDVAGGGGAAGGGGGGGGGLVAKARAAAARAKQHYAAAHAVATSHGAKQAYAVLLTPLVLAYCATLLALELCRAICTRFVSTICCCCSCGFGPPNSRPLPTAADPDRVVGTVHRVVGDPLSRSLESWAVAEPSSPAAKGLGPDASAATVSPHKLLEADLRADRLLRAPIAGAEAEVSRLRGGRAFIGDVLGELFLAWGGWAGALHWQTERAGSTVHMANVGAAVVGCHDPLSIEAIFDPTLTTRDDEGSGRLGLGVRDMLSSYFRIGAKSPLATAPVTPLLPCRPPQMCRPSRVLSRCKQRLKGEKAMSSAEKEIEEMEREAREAEQSGLPPAVVRMMHKRADRAKHKKAQEDAAAAEAAAVAAADAARDSTALPPPSHDAVREFYSALLPEVSADVSNDTRHTAACQMMAEVMNEWSKVQEPPQRPEWKALLDPRIDGAPVSWPALHNIRKKHRTFTAPTKKITLGSRVFFIGGWSHTVHFRPWWQIWFWRHGLLHRSRLERGVAIAARSYACSLYLGVTWEQIKEQPVLQTLVDSGSRRYGKTHSWWPQHAHSPILPWWAPRRWIDNLFREAETMEQIAEAVRGSPGWPEIAAAAAATGIAETIAVELVIGAISATHSTECFASPMLNAMLVLDRMIKRDEMDDGERIARLRDEDDLVARRGKGALLDSFVWECARHNGSYVASKVKRDVNVRDSAGQLYRIRRGTALLASTALASRDPMYWHEPHQFIPGRFVASIHAPELSQPSRGWKKSGAFTPAGEQKQRPERWARSAMTEPLPTLPLGCALGKLRELDPLDPTESDSESDANSTAEPTTPRNPGEPAAAAAAPDGNEDQSLQLKDRLQGGSDGGGEREQSSDDDDDDDNADEGRGDGDDGSDAKEEDRSQNEADAEVEPEDPVSLRNSSPQFALSAFSSAGQRWQLSRAKAQEAAELEEKANLEQAAHSSSRSSSSHRSPMLHLQHATLQWWVQRLLTIKDWHPDGEEATWHVGGSSWPSRTRWWQRARCPRFWQQRPSVLGDCCRGGAYYVEPIDSDDFDLHPSILRLRDTVFPVTPRGFFRLQEFGAPEKLSAGEDLDGWAQKDGAAGSEGSASEDEGAAAGKAGDEGA
jgi:hypothetical protein